MENRQLRSLLWLISFFMAVALAGFIGFLDRISGQGLCGRVLDAAYFTAGLFVGAFPASLESDPGRFLRVVRFLAIVLTFAAVILLAFDTIRRAFDALVSYRKRNHCVVIGSSPLALNLAANVRRNRKDDGKGDGKGKVSMLVTAPYEPSLTLRGVRQAYVDPDDDSQLRRAVKRVAAGARKVLAAVGDDDQSLAILDALSEVSLASGASGRIHVAFESQDVVASFAGRTIASSKRTDQPVEDEAQDDDLRIDGFRTVDRALSSDLSWYGNRPDPPAVAGQGGFPHHQLIVVGDGPLAEALISHASRAFGVVDGIELTCIGPQTQTIRRAVSRRNPWCRVDAVEVPGDAQTLASATAQRLREARSQGRVARVVVCGGEGRDSLSLARANAIARLAPSPLPVVAVLEGPRLPKPGLFGSTGGTPHDVSVWSIEDVLSNPVSFQYDPLRTVAKWSLHSDNLDVVRAALTTLEERGVLMVPGAAPEPLMPGDLLALRERLHDCAPFAGKNSFEVLSWAGRLPILFARCGYGVVRREPSALRLRQIDEMASKAHLDYWRELDDATRNAKQQLGMREQWKDLHERWRVTNRDQVWMYGVYLARAGYDVVERGRTTSEQFPNTEFLSDELVQFLAAREHDRWSRERRDSGWTRQPALVEQDVASRDHPLIDEPWASLDLVHRAKDIAVIRGLSSRLWRVGLAIRPITMTAAVEQLQAAGQRGIAGYRSRATVSAVTIDHSKRWTASNGQELEAQPGDVMLSRIDDPDSPIWSITAPRFEATYKSVGGDRYRRKGVVHAVQVGAGIEVDTNEGRLTTRSDDWIITDGLAEPWYWVQSADDFANQYEPVGSEQ